MIKVWNKKEEINGVSSDYVLESQTIRDSDEIFLVVNDVTGKVSEIQNKLTIADIYNIDPNLTCLEVGEEYLRIKAEEEEKQKLEQITIEQQAEKIKELEQGQANTEYILMEGGLI